MKVQVEMARLPWNTQITRKIIYFDRFLFIHSTYIKLAGTNIQSKTNYIRYPYNWIIRTLFCRAIILIIVKFLKLKLLPWIVYIQYKRRTLKNTNNQILRIPYTCIIPNDQTDTSHHQWRWKSKSPMNRVFNLFLILWTIYTVLTNFNLNTNRFWRYYISKIT